MPECRIQVLTLKLIDSFADLKKPMRISKSTYFVRGNLVNIAKVLGLTILLTAEHLDSCVES